MENSIKVADHSLSLSSVLTLIFVTLKLTGVVRWNWWWTLSPIIAAAAVGILTLWVMISYYVYCIYFLRKADKYQHPFGPPPEPQKK